MYILVTGNELGIVTSFYDTKKQAYDAMIDDIIISTGYESLEEIKKSAANGECELNENDAWAETNQNGTGYWKIEEVPEKAKETAKVASPVSRKDDEDFKTNDAYFEIALIEKPGIEGLTRSEVMDLMDMLSRPEGLPIDICDTNGNSSAMGFITPQAAEELEWEYDQNSDLGSFISDILDDMDKESEDGTYVYNDLRIWLNRV